MSESGDLNEDNKSSKMIIKTEAMKPDKMQEALTAIALEMQRYHESTVSSHNLTNSEEIFNKLLKLKSKLKSKNTHILKLRDNVNTACMVGRTVISAKDNETASLNNQLSIARSECFDLHQKHQKTSQAIQSITKENNALRNELENLANFIELGYKELQKISNGRFEEPSIVMQLKKIIVCCGQYYADYCNEYDRKARLEQRNRFLNSKLNILNNNMEVVTEELKNLRYQNVRLQKEIAFLKNGDGKRKSHKNFGLVYSECNIGNQNDFVNLTTAKVDFLTKIRNTDLVTHLSIVKKLLSDQDEMLKDLKCLTREVITSDRSSSAMT